MGDPHKVVAISAPQMNRAKPKSAGIRKAKKKEIMR